MLDSPLLPSDPAPRAARLIALEFLVAAGAARERMADPSEAEALHDLRVSLRRLRSHLRAFANELTGSAGRTVRRRLKRLARATGASRDAEVHLAWLRDQESSLSSMHRHGWSRLVRQLESEKADADARLGKTMAASFASTTARLGERLSRYNVTVHVHDGVAETPYAEVAAGRIEQRADKLQAAIHRISGASDQDAAHRARIAGKRLRYLLEPLMPSVGSAPALVADLKALQDTLGDLHDSHVFAPVIAAALEREAAMEAHRLSESMLAGQAEPLVTSRVRRNDPRAGLLELGARLHARGVRAFEQFSRDWMNDASASFFDRVGAMVTELRSQGVRPDREIERKYLLSALPEIAHECSVLDIEQGYLPGARVVERVRRVRSDADERYFRTIKGGLGLSRIEIEEEIDAPLFRSLWKLTSGRRIAKRRYVVSDGDFVWELDAFSDIELVLAEVELPAEDTAVELPAWLAPHVVREVTGEVAYANVTLATRRDDAPVAIDALPERQGKPA